MSIALTNPIQVKQGNTVTENDLDGANMVYSLDFSNGAGLCSIIFKAGNRSGATFVVGALAPNVSMTVDLNTGIWSASDGVGGTLTGPQLSSFVAAVKSLRNTIETFASTSGVVPGTDVPW